MTVCKGAGREVGPAIGAIGEVTCPVCHELIVVNSDGRIVAHDAPELSGFTGPVIVSETITVSPFTDDQLRAANSALATTILELFDPTELPDVAKRPAAEVAEALIRGFRQCHRCRSDKRERRASYGLCATCLASLDEQMAIRKMSPKWHGFKLELLASALDVLLERLDHQITAIKPGTDGARQKHDTLTRRRENVATMIRELERANETKGDLIIRGGLT